MPPTLETIKRLLDKQKADKIKDMENSLASAIAMRDHEFITFYREQLTLLKGK